MYNKTLQIVSFKGRKFMVWNIHLVNELSLKQSTIVRPNQMKQKIFSLLNVGYSETVSIVSRNLLAFQIVF